MQETIIRPNQPWWKIDFKELWDYREVLYIFGWRDIKVRYKQTLFGVIWVFLQPLITAGVFSVLFGKIAKLPSDGLPYPLFVFCGLLFWNFFSNSLSSAATSIINSESIIKKVYFPKILILFASIATPLVDFLVVLPVFIIASILWGYVPNVSGLFLLPIMLLILILSILGLGMILASLNVWFRDVRYVLGFALQTGLYLTPVIYPISVFYDWRKNILLLNPMTGVLENARAILTHAPPNYPALIVGFLVALGVFIIGLAYFRKTEERFSDVV